MWLIIFLFIILLYIVTIGDSVGNGYNDWINKHSNNKNK